MQKSETTPLVEMRGITKRFPGVVANASVDFTLNPGEIHALLGENGAGKTTLMNILYGLYAADEGELFIKGKRVKLTSPADAIANQVGMIHQHFMLIPTLTVSENVALCLKQTNPFRLNLAKVKQKIRGLSELYGLDVNPDALVSDLSVGEQQRVEILKVLYRGVDILIMDEPTAVLTPNEAKALFKVLKVIVQQGNGIIFISHKLWEVTMISNRVTVLRDGRRVDTIDTASVNKEQLAAMMVGRELVLQYEHPQMPRERDILVMKDVSVKNSNQTQTLKNISLTVSAGEIVGIAGVDGNGQKELAEVIHGLQKVSNGSITLLGQDITHKPAKEIIEMGLGHIPEDRHSRGVVLDFSVAENAVLIGYDKPPITEKGMYHPSKVKKAAAELQAQFDVRCSGLQTPIRNLSGGNQQKVVLGREILRKPNLLIAAQPSRGLDIGATEYTQRTLIEERNHGMAILLISTDLDEILAVSDRVLVLFEGEIMGEVIPGKTSIEEIGLLMAGSKQSADAGGKLT